LPVVNVTSTVFALMYAVVCIAVLRHRRRSDVPAAGYRVPGGRWLVWAAVAFSLYLIALSLVQQRMDSGQSFPVEWWLLLGLGAAGWTLWVGSAASRRGVSEQERRRIILEEAAQ
jgi:L-asparagine transporter-like permease